MMRPFMGTTCDVRHCRFWGRCDTGRCSFEWKMSNAASMGMMSPSWTLPFFVSQVYSTSAEGTYKLKKSFPAFGPFDSRFAVALNHSHPNAGPNRFPGPAR